MDHDSRITGQKLTTPRAGLPAGKAFSVFLISDLVLNPISFTNFV
jgi:hypothetical protein